MSLDAATWRPLNPTKSEIRLLKLEPSGSLDAWPRGQLEVTSLNDRLAYDAISYAWGRAQALQPLFLGDVDMAISANLCAALRHLRHRSEPRYLWVDAICISQHDPVERAQQVALMRQIFREAKTVLVWLGWGERSTERALAELKDLLRPRNNKPGRFHDVDLDPPAGPHIHRGLETISQADFWSRLWCLQEVVLARHLTMQYGKASCEVQFLQGAKINHLRSTLREPSQNTWRTTHLFEDLVNYNNLLRRTSFCSVQDSLRTILAFFGRARTSIVSDQRDRVYGLLGICVSYFGKDFIQPDYTIDTANVYTTFAWRTIQQTDSLLIISQAGFDLNSLDSLPSWVPDWSSAFDHRHQDHLLARWKLFKAAPDTADQVAYLSDDTRTLCVRGVLHGAISCVGEVYYGHPDDSDHLAVLRMGRCSATLRRWRKVYNEWFSSHTSREWDVDKAPQSFQRTVTLDTNLERTQQLATPYRGLIEPSQEYARLPEHTVVFEDGTYAMSNDPGHHTGAKGWLNYKFLRLESGIKNRRFFVTGDGLPGIGPRDTRSGDFVAVVFGANMPLILRKAPSAQLENAYTLVGVCYLDGLMDGQAFQETAAGALQDFYLV
jgi:hypothetical protein